MQNGYVWELTTWARPITGNGSGYWPTPNAEGGVGYMSGSNRDTWRPTLEVAAQMAPEGEPPRITAEAFRGKGRKAAMWPTPTAHTNGDWQTFIQQRLNATTRQKMVDEQIPLPTGQGQLNPTFVEWLMGWPRDWTRPGPLNGTMFLAWLRVFRDALTA